MSAAGQQVNLVKVNRGRGKNGARCSLDWPYSPPPVGAEYPRDRQSSMPVVGAFFRGLRLAMASAQRGEGENHRDSRLWATLCLISESSAKISKPLTSGALLSVPLG